MNQVRLIAFTQPIELEGVQTGEELVAYCARVSNPATQANHDLVLHPDRHSSRVGLLRPLHQGLVLTVSWMAGGLYEQSI